MQLIRYQTSPFLYPTRFSTPWDQLVTLAFTGSPRQKSDLPIDLYEDQHAVILQAELPGYQRENITIDLAEDRLTLTVRPSTPVESQNPEKSGEEKPFSRSIQLPDRVDLEKITARYENGLLTVTLPRLPESKPKAIQVEIK